jgi:hypothetical protein
MRRSQFDLVLPRRSFLTGALTISLLIPTVAWGDSTRCAGAKLKVAATYAGCRLRAEARAASSSQAIDAAKLAKCDATFEARWQKAEERDASSCPTIGDGGAVHDLLEAVSDGLAGALAGAGGLPSCDPCSSPTTTVAPATTLPGPTTTVSGCQVTGQITTTTTTTTTVIERCTNGLEDGPETDVDCGGSDCLPCAPGFDCNVNGDCKSKVCFGGSCAAPTCVDGERNGDETSIDCGGGACPGCPPGELCFECTDCASLHCDSNSCQ